MAKLIIGILYFYMQFLFYFNSYNRHMRFKIIISRLFNLKWERKSKKNKIKVIKGMRKERLVIRVTSSYAAGSRQVVVEWNRYLPSEIINASFSLFASLSLSASLFSRKKSPAKASILRKYLQRFADLNKNFDRKLHIYSVTSNIKRLLQHYAVHSN